MYVSNVYMWDLTYVNTGQTVHNIKFLTIFNLLL